MEWIEKKHGDLKDSISSLNDRMHNHKFVPIMKGVKPEREMNQGEETVWKMGTNTFNYYAGYASNSAIVLFLLSQGFFRDTGVLPFGQFVILAITGFLGWTLLEYWFHRLPYHHGNNPLVLGHLFHHESPQALIGIPYYVTALLYLPIFFGLSFILDPAKLGVFMAFLWVGYINYCVIHHGSHRWASKSKLFNYLKRHHLVHHHRPDKNFSFTFPLWDWVFRTMA